MSISDKFRETFSQSKGFTEKLSQKYREHIGEELAKKHEQLRELEAELNERKKELDAREAELKKFYRIPRWAVILPALIALLAGSAFVYQQLQPSIAELYRSNELTAPATEPSSSQSMRGTSYSECVSKGIAYYKEIGSYPNFSTGEDAVKVARELCERSQGLAFGE